MNPESARKSDAAVACGAFAIACACLVLAGWKYRLDDLQGLFIQGVPPIPPLSALSMGLLGVVLTLLGVGTAVGVARALSILVGAFGVFAGLSNVIGFDSPVFLALFPDEVVLRFSSSPGRPAPQTALSIAMLAFGMLAAWSPRRPMFLASQCVLISSFAGAWTTLFSFTVNASEIYRLPWHPASGMSVYSACGVLVLSVGAMSLRTDAGLALLLVSPTLGGRFSRLLLPTTLFVPLLLGLVLRSSDVGGQLPTELTTWAVSVYCLLIAAVAIRMSWLAGTYESRLLDAQKERDEVISKLQHTLEEVRRLETDMVRICGWTKMIEDEGRWIPFEQFLTERLHLHVTNAISPQGLEQIKRGDRRLPTGQQVPS